MSSKKPYLYKANVANENTQKMRSTNNPIPQSASHDTILQTYDTQYVIKIQARLRIFSYEVCEKIYKNNTNSEKHGDELVVVVPLQIGRLSPSPIRILANITLSMRVYTLPTYWCMYIACSVYTAAPIFASEQTLSVTYCDKNVLHLI